MGTDRSQAFKLITAIKLQLFPQTVSDGDSKLQSRVCSLQETGHNRTVKVCLNKKPHAVSRLSALHIYSMSEGQIFVTSKEKQLKCTTF